MGLLDDFSSFIKTPEGMGLLSAVAGGLAGAQRGAPINSIGRAGLAGVMGYGNALDRQERTMENEQQRKLRQMQMDEYMKKAQEAEKERAFFSDPSRFISTPAQQALANGQGPTNENAAAIPSFSPQLDIKSLYGEMLKSGSPSLGMKAIEGLAKQEQPKLKEIKNFSIGGKVSPVMIFENGKAKTMDGYDVPPEIVLQNLGNRVQAIDKNTLMGGENLSIGISPDTVYSGGITMRGQNMTDARARESNNAPSYHDGAWVYKPTPTNPSGTSVSIPGINKMGNPTEGERKAATLLQRLEGSLKQLNNVTSVNSGAATPEFFGTLGGSIPFIGDATKNILNSSDRQRVEAAQLDILDAALTLGTGAAYTKEQLEGYRRSYFPQVGDSDAVVADKQDRLNNVIAAAKVAAGRAANQVVIPEPENANKHKENNGSAKSKSVKLDDGTSVIATLGKDGNYYVKKNGKTYRVEE